MNFLIHRFPLCVKVSKFRLQEASRYKAVLTFIMMSLLVPQSLFASESEQTFKTELNAFIEQALTESGVPGVSIVIVKDGKTIIANGFGIKNIESGKKVDEDTLFAIASNTKAFTAAAIGILVEQGKMKWDDRVIDHLPYFELHDQYASQNMRVIDILSHRMGYSNFSGDLLWYDTQYTPEEIIRRAKYVKPTGFFRYNYGYSNIGYITAGEIITQQSGKSWGNFVRDEIFRPIGMKSSATSYKNVKRKSRLASPHLEYVDDKNNIHILPMDWHHNEAIDAAGSIITSANDMSKWLVLQLSNGQFDDKKIFNQKTSKKMWTAHTVLNTSPKLESSDSHLVAYGLGWFLKDFNNRLMVYHSGSLAGMTSKVTLIPQEKLGIAVFTNSTVSLAPVITDKIIAHYLSLNKTFDLVEQFKQQKLSRVNTVAKRMESLGPVIKDAPMTQLIDNYAGIYSSKMYGDIEVTESNAKLRIQFKPSPMLKGNLIHRHYDVFTLEWDEPRAWINSGTAQFISNAKGEITELKLNVPNDDIWFDEPVFLRKGNVE